MREIVAYQAVDGSIHSTKQAAIDKDKAIRHAHHHAKLERLMADHMRMIHQANGRPMTYKEIAAWLDYDFCAIKKEMEEYSSANP